MRPSNYPLQDGPSYAFDVKPLEEELILAEQHPEYGIDVPAVEAALAEARADLDDLAPEITERADITEGDAR